MANRRAKNSKSVHQYSRVGRREPPWIWIGAGIALAVVVIAVFAIRLYGITPHETRTTTVRLAGSTIAQSDSNALAQATTKACRRPHGLIASVLDFRPPSHAIVVATATSGAVQRFTANCRSGAVTPTG